MRKLLLRIFTMLFSILLYGQELPKITPPSPTAYELGKYGDIEIGHFTGTIQKTIPLLNYKVKGLNVPISLSYSSNGIKVDQLSSNVGLGWSINMGGVISRAVADKPDEDRTLDIPQSIIGNYTSDEATLFFERFVNNRSDADTSVDIFNYNFMGKVGRFVLDENKQPVNLTPNGIIIERENGFTITDENGIKYFFTTAEKTQHREYGDGHTIPELYVTTAWYLTKVVHINGVEIYFSYGSGNYSYDSGKAQSLRILDPYLQTTCTNNMAPNGISIGRVVTTRSNIENSRSLKSITNNLTSDRVLISYKGNQDIGGIGIVNDIILVNDIEQEVEKINLEHLTTANNRIFLQRVNFTNPLKKYEFSYISPDLLPKRLSFSQDHWGYYNGKSNTHFFPNPSKIKGMGGLLANQNVGGDKEVNPTTSQYGMLKQIKYPTGGVSKFEYENNSYWDKEEVLSTERRVNLRADTNGGQMGNTVSQIMNNIKVNQEVELFKSVRFNDYDCDPDYEIPHHTRAFITIENLTQNQGNIIFRRTVSGDHNVGNSINFSPSNPYNNTYIKLLANSDYRITLSTTTECILAGASFTYYEGNSSTIYKNHLLGGVRIKKIKNIASSGIEEIKTFYYGKKESKNASSGQRGQVPWYVLDVTNRVGCQVNCSYKDIKYKVLVSSSLRNLYSSSTSFSTNYRHITTSYGGENFENGGEEVEYYIAEDGPGRLIMGNYIRNHPRDNWGWSNGLLKTKLLFKKSDTDFVKLKETQNTYLRDERIDKNVYGFTIRNNFNTICQYSSPNRMNLEGLDIMESRYRTNWFYVDQTIEKLYNPEGNNPTTTTNYFYDNPNHLQQTRVETTNSQGEVLKTETKYAHDVNDTRLISEHRIAEPLEVKTYKGANLLNYQKTEFDSIHNISNLYLPKFIQTLKGGSSESNILEDRVVYHSYDDKGNPTELSKADGTHIVYIWGYNQTQPIAKIENARLSDITTATITDLQTKSNSDNDRTIGSTGNEGNLRIALNNLRSLPALSKAQVTTFTFDPLIGVTSITDPRGETIYYEYDSFNRLEFIKDSEGNILKEHKYHYKN